MIFKILIFLIIMSSGFFKFLNAKEMLTIDYFTNKKIINNTIDNWRDFIKIAACKYQIDEKLIKSIIYVESSGNPYIKSSSNAIGLMQIKPSSAGLDVYRLKGKKGQPSTQELYNPRININIGAAYISLLQKKNLIGITNQDVMRYATIVSYVNGVNTFLQIFSKNRIEAISIINTMTIKCFLEHIKKNIQKNKPFVI